ncbi:MAG: F0F1 ATP synthase subunit gamma [Proteobacteria bacterium]|nr:F0F1 ATP synthase subunit gamma [Pseudomonadota bacterium]
MSTRAQIRRHLGVLDDIGGIMGAMKNISLMETHKIARFLVHQHRVLAGVEAAAEDFLGHHPEYGYRSRPGDSDLIVAIGSQRGFCGDFNKSLADAVFEHRRHSAAPPPRVVAVGRRLASNLSREPGIVATLDGPSVAEEVQPVLHRLMNSLAELQAEAGRDGPIAVTVFAHRDGEAGVASRPILPVPRTGSATPRFSSPPLLNLEAGTFFPQLANHYLWAQMHDVFYGSLMAENRRRLQHLEGATQRIQDKTARLQQKYNLLRQEEITEEIEVILLSNEALQTVRGAVH